MKLIVTQDNLAKALNNASRVASSKTQLPILNNILLKTDSNRLLVASTNLDIALTQYVGARVLDQGSITVPARLITEFISSLPKGAVNLELEDNHLKVTCEQYSSVINGIAADEFPELPTIDENSSIKYVINVNDFKTAVSQTIIAASNDNTRPILTGVYWHSSDSYLYLAATDGYRLAERKLVETKSEIDAIIPARSLEEVLRSISDDTKEIDVLFDDSQVRFRVNETEIVSRLIDGHYPDYRQLIPGDLSTNLKLNRSDFMKVIKVASLFARESGGGITLMSNKSDGTLSIHSIASELGENTSVVKAEIDNDGEITLNSRYLIEALNAFEEDEITFSFNGKLSPSIIRPVNSKPNYFHIIMPLKS